MMTGESDSVLKWAIAGTWCALIAGVLNPLDVSKVRMMRESVTGKKHEGLIKKTWNIYRSEGYHGWLRGLNASMARELLYSSIRIGWYEPIRMFISNRVDKNNVGSNSSPIVKFSSSFLSGGIGAAIANPLDLIKIRFQSYIPKLHAPLPYQSSTTAFFHIINTEGMMNGLYRGWHVTSSRAAILNCAQLGSYDSIKNNILINRFGFENGYVLHTIASMLAGLITTTAVNPLGYYFFATIAHLFLTRPLLDCIKSIYLSDSDNLYKSPLQVITRIYTKEGIRGFFFGWTPAYLRLGPHTVLSFIAIEKTRQLFGIDPI